MGIIDDNLLTFLTFFPLWTALGLLGTSVVASMVGASGLPNSLWKPIALASSLITFLLSLRLFVVFDPLKTGFQLTQHSPWIPGTRPVALRRVGGLRRQRGRPELDERQKDCRDPATIAHAVLQGPRGGSEGAVAAQGRKRGVYVAPPTHSTAMVAGGGP